MDSWFLKVLIDNWERFGTKKVYKTLAQKGHTWKRIERRNKWERQYICKDCSFIIRISIYNGFTKYNKIIITAHGCHYARHNIQCKEIVMHEALG